MATVTSDEDGVYLDLSHEEAGVVYQIMGRVLGSNIGSPRQHTSAIFYAFESLRDDEVSYQYDRVAKAWAGGEIDFDDYE